MFKRSLLGVFFLASICARSEVLMSVMTPAGMFEVRRSQNADWSIESAIFIAGKQFWSSERTLDIYGFYNFGNQSAEQVAIVSDCGASFCYFRAFTICKDKDVSMTDEFGNGADRPSLLVEGESITMNFGLDRDGKSISISSIKDGKVVTVKKAKTSK